MAADPAAGRAAMDRRQLWVLVLLTLVWGINWPIMKLGVSGWPQAPERFPPLTFRALSMLLGLPVLGGALVLMKIPLGVPRAQWRQVLWLALPNMVVWHIVVIVSVQRLSSGRAAILGYTMPVFAALWGLLVFGERLGLRPWLGVAAAGLGVALLLWHEFAALTGAPFWAVAMLGAACIWALGTHMLRRASFTVPLLTVVFWMTALTAVVMSVLAFWLERDQWRWPEPHVLFSIGFNAVGVFGFAHAAWFYLARTLPPLASSISVMMIPVLGLLSGAVALGEVLHWQDFAAMAALVLAIGAVLWRPQPPGAAG